MCRVPPTMGHAGALALMDVGLRITIELIPEAIRAFNSQAASLKYVSDAGDL